MVARQSARWVKTVSFVLIGVLFLAASGLSGCRSGAGREDENHVGAHKLPEPALSNDLIRGCKPAERPAGMPPPPGMRRGEGGPPSPDMARPPEEPLPSGDSATIGLEEGGKAVNFKLKDIHGSEFVLSRLLAKKPVVMVFGSFT